MSDDRPVTMAHIVAAVSEVFKLPARNITFRHRDARSSAARQVCMWLARELTRLTQRQVALALALRDHSSVAHGVGKIDDLLAEDPALSDRVDLARCKALAYAASSQPGRVPPDPVAAAERVLLGDRDVAAMRVSVEESVAMAARLCALEEVAAGVYQLLCLMQEYDGCRGRPRATDLRTSILALVDGLAEQLDALGYEVAEADATDPTPDQETARERPAAE